MKDLLLHLAPPLGAFLIKLIYLTCKKEFHLPKRLPDPDEPIIVAFWHGELLMQPFLYRKLRADHKVAVMISDHRDGELIARVVRYFGIEAVRGSSRRGGVKALIAALKKLNNGYDIAITPDGPKGPRRSVAPGIVALAQRSGAMIYAFSYTPSRYWQLQSWDRFVIPKPFSRIDFYVSEPLKIDGIDDNEAKKLVRSLLDQITKTE